MNRSPRTLSAVLLLLLILSCSGNQTQDPQSRIEFSEDLVLGLDPDLPLGRIQDVCVDGKGSIYVLDSGFKTIRKFGSDGRFLANLGNEGSGPGEFQNPSCLGLMPDGRLLVGGFDSWLSLLDPQGTLENNSSVQKPFFGSIFSLACDRTGSIYFCGIDVATHKMVHKLSGSNYDLVSSFSDSYAADQNLDRRLESMYAIGHIRVQGDRLYYLQAAPQAIRVFDLEGNLLRELDARETPEPPPPTPSGSGMSFTFPPLSNSLIVFENGHVMVTVFFPATEDASDGHTMIDLYDSAGARIASVSRKGAFSPMFTDSLGRIYVPEAREGMPVLVRYLVEYAD